jgi:peptidoglycan glycosyltransferase
MGMAWRHPTTLALIVAFIGGAIGFITGPGSADAPPEPRSLSEEPTRAAPPARVFPGLDPRAHRVVDGVAVADLADGSTAVLTLQPDLQAHVEALYDRYEVPFGGLVAMDPRSGRVLAYVSHSSVGEATDLARDPSPPAASIFKVITGAALLDAGVNPEEEVCIHGGASRITLDHLEPDPRRDRSCVDLGEAMGGSVNAVFARLADRHLEPATLERYGSAFGFGHALPFDVPTRASPMEVPRDRLEFARTAAGFWHTHLSPLHGALIAATVASGGEMPRAFLVEEVLDGRGRQVYQASPQTFRSVIPRTTAQVLTRLMEHTVRQGTARRSFFDQQGNAFLPGIRVAGKTGTLAGERPYRGYTWFVGFAPADDPEIAVAALVVNEPRWRIKAAYAAREALRYHLVEGPRRAARRAREAERAAASADAAAETMAAETAESGEPAPGG